MIWITPFIDTNEANSIRIEVEFSMKKCSRYQNPSLMTACKESFNLYFYEAESDIADDVIPSWDATTYDLVDTITADHSYTGYQKEENKLIIEKRDMPLPKGLRSVYLALQDTGVCVSLMSLKIYYTVCANIFMNYLFLETPVGSSPQALEEREGVCVANSQRVGRQTLLCRFSGEWYYNSGNCQCLSEYQRNNGTECRVMYNRWNTISFRRITEQEQKNTDKETTVCIGLYKLRNG
ncbi:ephrin type-B receptor 2-like [Mytilus edulis]|uniref:ephrin type-B receptor 2-like n=1 Tax=Mytilus edulis TaxID=6550 RepID=UPI0039EEEB18